MSDAEPPFQRSGVAARKESLYFALLAGCALLTLAITAGIVLSLLGRTLVFFSEVSILDYVTGTDWSPLIGTASYGVLPLVSGTLLVTLVSAVIALPIGLAIAVYLSEYASPRVRAVLKPALEVLAGIPTVVYGYFALVYVTPLVNDLAGLPIRATLLADPVQLSAPAVGSITVPAYALAVPSLRTFNVFSASLVVGLMVIPMVSSISEDAISAVPDRLRNAAYGLGSTKFDVSTRVVVPAAASGIVSSYVLAVSRAIGETMAVTIAAGQSPALPTFPAVLENLSESTQTITAAMVQIAQAESRGGVVFESMFALGMTLFAITLAMNVVAELIRRRYREVYD